MTWDTRLAAIRNRYAAAKNANTLVPRYLELLDLMDALIPFAKPEGADERELVKNLIGADAAVLEGTPPPEDDLPTRSAKARIRAVNGVRANATEMLIDNIHILVKRAGLENEDDQAAQSPKPAEQLLIGALPIFIGIEAGQL